MKISLLLIVFSICLCTFIQWHVDKNIFENSDPLQLTLVFIGLIISGICALIGVIKLCIEIDV